MIKFKKHFDMFYHIAYYLFRRMVGDAYADHC